MEYLECSVCTGVNTVHSTTWCKYSQSMYWCRNSAVYVLEKILCIIYNGVNKAQFMYCCKYSAMYVLV